MQNQDLFYTLSKKTAKSILRDNIECLSKYALIIIKPESLVSNKLEMVISLLKKHNFEIVYYKFMKINASQVIALWENSWNNVSLERVLINQKIYNSYYSLIIILKNSHSNYQFNELIFNDASTYITCLKGSANKAVRDKGTFRDILKPINYIINYIHTSDDTENMLREIGVLFTVDEMFTIFERIKRKLFYSYEIIRKESTKFQSYSINFDLNEIAINNLLSTFYKELLNNPISNIPEVKVLINKAINTKLISLELLNIVLDNNIVPWDWNHIIIFSTYIRYTNN